MTHVNEGQKCITCSLCKSRRWCAHREGVNRYVFEKSGGRLDIKQLLKSQDEAEHKVFDAETDEVRSAVSTKPKDLSSKSSKPIPVPRCFATMADLESGREYYEATPLETKGFPKELRCVPWSTPSIHKICLQMRAITTSTHQQRKHLQTKSCCHDH